MFTGVMAVLEDPERLKMHHLYKIVNEVVLNKYTRSHWFNFKA